MSKKMTVHERLGIKAQKAKQEIDSYKPRQKDTKGVGDSMRYVDEARVYWPSKHKISI